MINLIYHWYLNAFFIFKQNRNMKDHTDSFVRILTIMNELREKCPWDQKQTIDTLRPLTIEETFELSDVIINKDWKGIKEELGDMLLHIVFYAKIGEEQGEFDISDVINTLCEKLIIRHPHIYSDTIAENEEQVKQNWEKIKMKEGRASVLSGVPSGLSSLIKASRIQEKAGKVGFEWDDIADVWRKIEEEIAELKHEVEAKNQEKIEKEFGDVLFALVNYSRYLKIDADTALELSNKKFIQRFKYIEGKASEMGKVITDMTLGEMDALWNEAKAIGIE
jgi:XTP/dITP diphosphohydrolase